MFGYKQQIYILMNLVHIYHIIFKHPFVLERKNIATYKERVEKFVYRNDS